MPSDLQYLTDENVEEIGTLLPHHQPTLQLTLAHGTSRRRDDSCREDAIPSRASSPPRYEPDRPSLLAEHSFDGHSAAEEGQVTATGTE